jgi:excisionase family DNA binding protein
MNKEILNLEEAAELFGVSIKTFIKLLKEEKVPARKIGREWRFSSKALINWLSSGDSQFYSSSERDSKEFFNEIAEKWDKIRQEYYDESIKNKLFDNNLLESNMIVMDIGAGNGYFSLSVSRFVKKVISVDISVEMINELKRKAEKGNIKNIELIESDGLDVPVEDSCVDLICTNMYLHHIEKPEEALKEMYRILKPGGKIFLSDYLEHKNKKLVDEMHDLWFGFSKLQLEEYLKKSSFKNIKYEKLDNKLKNDLNIIIVTALK